MLWTAIKLAWKKGGIPARMLETHDTLACRTAASKGQEKDQHASTPRTPAHCPTTALQDAAEAAAPSTHDMTSNT
jgi:hypothetical protein